MTRRNLTVVPDPPAAVTLTDLSKDELADWLRRMTDASRGLCDAVDSYLGPEHPAPRPQLTIIPGGLEVER